MAEDAYDARPTRTEKKRRARAIIDQSRQVLEDFILVPEHKMTRLDVAEAVSDDLLLLRRLKPSGARARLLKNLAERLDEDEMVVLGVLIRGDSVQGPSGEDTPVDPVRELVGRLMAPGEEVLQEVRERHPQADHQHLRQLVLRGRRSRKSPPAKAAREKLFKFLGEL